MTGAETGSLLCRSHSHPGWAFPFQTVTCDDHLVRHKPVRITNPLPQHHLPNRITQHNKLHKIIKLITTLNPCLIQSAQLTYAGIHIATFTATKENRLIRLENTGQQLVVP